MGRWLFLVILASGCGSSSPATDAATGLGPDGTPTCHGDNCDVVTNTGCDPDMRCTVIELNQCFFTACEAPGPMQLGDPCDMSNNEGAETWDNCAPTLVCDKSVCTQACGTSGKACVTPLQCVPDPDVGVLSLNICAH